MSRGPARGNENMPGLKEDSPKALPFPSHGKIEHRGNPAVDRNADPLVGPFECVGMESLIVSDAFHTLPAVDLCQKCAHGTIIEGRADKVHTLAFVIDAVAPGLHDLVACSGIQMMSRSKRIVE